MRADKYLAEKFGSRTKAAKAISEARVLVNGKAIDAAYDIRDNDRITIKEAEENYVSNGGFKLAKAIRDFNYDVRNKVFADVGASNGGFTDCLFQNGAQKVYCIDVGESQLDPALRENNVKIYDNFNARNLNAQMFDEPLDGAVVDVSFISLTYVLGPIAGILRDGKHLIALVKPQFECESKNVGKNGIVKDPAMHRRILKKIYDFAYGCGLSAKNLTNAPLHVGKNKEYLFLFEKNGNKTEFSALIKYVKL
ncbi:MAG: TlyA family RNA methyltransferase [Candidatus Coproplasma sp.]